MKILLTGATGYIGRRILPSLIEKGHHVVCCTRDLDRFTVPESLQTNISVIRLDLLEKESLVHIPQDIDAAYYLVHSMSGSKNYLELEKKSAENFKNRIEQTDAQQVIYLSGMINEEKLSNHLQSRKNVEAILAAGQYNLTVLRAGIIIGSGSASFEIIRDLVEKLPIMIAPKWLNTKCQPLGISDVIKFLVSALFKEPLYNKNFDIGGPDVLTYKEMLLGFAKVRKLKRRIITVPVMTPRLSSYWLYFVTSTSYRLAIALVDSMKVPVVARNDNINQILNIHPISYEETLERSFVKIKQNEVVSSWKDSLVSGTLRFKISEFINVPEYGCFIDQRKRKVHSREQTIRKVWAIGGENGWYVANMLWKLRGYLDKLVGGVGLRRGRTHRTELEPGDALDFWRVLFADKDEGKLLLFAEMKLPGEAWLEFKIQDEELIQTATFRPKGLWGRLYWYAVYPFHGIVFNGMVNKLAE